ncbi:MAG TPA: 60S ribosomal export protein NMD3 [Thermoplasmata archaeon]|nr:60S ribosomal export protein NMD3 [Thermoplasmata archaeon]
MGGDEFCVVCGATGRALVDGVCAECAASRTPLVQIRQRVDIVICPTCGARRVGQVWQRSGASPLLTAEDLAPFLVIHPEVGVRKVDWEETSVTPMVREYTAHAIAVFRHVERVVDLPFSVRIEHRTCPECSRRSGGYFTAILQLRGPADARPVEKPPALRARLDAEWDRLWKEARPDWQRALQWREELPEGWDCYFSDTLAARAVARMAKQRFGASLKESASLFGRKDGRDVYRVTFCLRFPRPAGRPTVKATDVEP